MFTIAIKNGQTWLVCGGRDFADAAVFNGAMSDLLRLKGCPKHVVHGGARGADAMAEEWAHRMALYVTAVEADWRKHGNAAGPIRNQEMLDKHKPSLVVAFPGGRGTADMVRRAREAGIDVAEIKLRDVRLPTQHDGRGLSASGGSPLAAREAKMVGDGNG